MSCDCINIVNEKLAERNMELDVTFLLNSGETTLSLPTHWKDPSKKKRGQKPPAVIVSYCPFCEKSAEKESVVAA